MKLRCPKQHRIGEVCGRKFIDTDNITRMPEDCRLCKDIEIKKNRLSKEVDNIRRWSQEGKRFESSISKARAQATELAGIIREMESRRPKNIFAKQGGDSGGAAGMSVATH